MSPVAHKNFRWFLFRQAPQPLEKFSTIRLRSQLPQKSLRNTSTKLKRVNAEQSPGFDSAAAQIFLEIRLNRDSLVHNSLWSLRPYMTPIVESVSWAAIENHIPICRPQQTLEALRQHRDDNLTNWLQANVGNDRSLFQLIEFDCGATEDPSPLGVGNPSDAFN